MRGEHLSQRECEVFLDGVDCIKEFSIEQDDSSIFYRWSVVWINEDGQTRRVSSEDKYDYADEAANNAASFVREFLT